MRKGRLEQFIDDNRTEFDSELPNMKLWGEIDKAVNPKPKKGHWQIASRAVAGIALLLFFGYLSFGNFYQKEYQNINKKPQALAVDQNPELSEIKDYYSNRINKSMGKLVAIGHHDPDLFRDIKQMEMFYDTLQMEWAKNPHKSDDQLVNAMIENYKSRSELLENVLQHIERKNNNFSLAQPAMFNHK